MARRLLVAIVYEKCCRSGDKLNLDDLVEASDIGDWKMSDFETARAHVAAMQALDECLALAKEIEDQTRIA